jgi:maltose-binding protein MalE
MKKVFSNSIILAILCAMLLSLTSCDEYKIKSNEKLKYYTINNEDSVCVELIQKYNNYCLKNLDESYQIEIVEFDSEDTMLTKISTEIMAGKGPDIISLNQKLPFEKLIDNGSFADIDELAELYKSDIDFDDYNSTIMDCGIYNGKRYIIPIAYCPNILITTQEILDKYNLSNVDVLKVGHHGSKTSSSKEFINVINPKYSIISVGKNNRYGHPNKEVLNNLSDSKIYRTDQDGSIMFKIKNTKLKIETCGP